MAEILDSGARTEYASGAVRDVKEDKGRMDLLPLDIIKELITYKNGHPDQHTLSEDYMFTKFDMFIRQGNTNDLYEVLQTFINREYAGDFEKAIMELSIHYEQGSRKYQERNWELGIPCHSFADSALRHGVKYFRGDDDEPHNRAFMWNIVGLLWTMIHKPELNDLPFAKEPEKIVPTVDDIVGNEEMTEEEINNELQDLDIEPDHILTNTISDRIESEAVKNEIAMFVFKIFYEEINKEEPDRVSKMVGQMANKMYSEDYKLYILEKDAEEPIIMDIPSDSIGFYNNDGFAEIHVLLDFQDKNMAKVIDLVNDSAQLRIFIGCRVVAEIAGEKDYVGYEFPIGEHYFTMTYPLEASPKYKAPAEENTGISLEPVESDDEVSNNDCSISMEAIESNNDETDGGEERFSEEDNVEENFDKSDVDKKED